MEFNPVKLKELRELKSLSQRDLEEISGVSHVSISRIETGRRKPWPKTVRRLADALGVEPAALMRND